MPTKQTEMEQTNKHYGSRLREITAVLRKHNITRGVTPEKLRQILEDLGPTYIKLGQIMSLHSDILPKSYCDELMRLCSEVAPMPFSEVLSVIEGEFGCPWNEIFSEIQEKPLGSASIAQVHKAVLLSGKSVVVKVQRKGIYEVMSRDIALLRKVVRLMPPVSIKEMVDLDLVLDELWAVTQEEMDFLKEADNLEEFAGNNADVAFVATPVLYREYTTRRVLVMEYIDGFAVDDKEKLQENGYDLEEIGTKLADNYVRQVMEDGFFHADPHPGNVKIREGKIIWIDMGMMGRLSQKDREQVGKAIRGVAMNDIGMIQEAVLALGQFREKPNKKRLYEGIRDLMEQYGSMDMGNIDLAVLFQELMEIMKENKIVMPHGLTMLARGLTHMEGVLVEISPRINMVQIAAARIKGQLLKEENWKKEAQNTGKRIYYALNKALDVPSLTAELLQGYLKGDSRFQLDLHVSRDLAWLLRLLVRNLVLGLWVMALLISSSIICTTEMKPQVMGIPLLGALGYFGAFVIMLYVLIRHIVTKKK